MLGLLYDELRALADALIRREPAGHTLQPTALVNEAYIRLVDGDRVDFEGRTHFRALSARAMRQVLVDHARARKAAKRGGGAARQPLDEHVPVATGGQPNAHDTLDLADAIEQLEARDARQAKVVELRYFGGLTDGEIADLLQVSTRTVRSDWRFARAWLRSALGGEA